MKATPIAVFQPTKAQREWVDKEAIETGESIASIMRGLIQAQVNKDKRKAK